ncbi:MAG: DUF58 domain-containing protein [Luteolibacter sp.]
MRWFSRRIRPAGAGALAITLFAGFMSFGQPRTSIFQLFCFAAGLVTLAFVWVIFRKSHLSATFLLPRHATVGEPVRYTVSIRNNGRKKLTAANVEQTPPDPRPSLTEFSQLKEPGEDDRNLFDRTMIYYRWQWLTSRKAAFTTSSTEDQKITLEPGETKRISLSLTPGRRGILPLSDLRALLPEPLGLFQKCRSIATSPANLAILPHRYPLPDITMPGSAAFHIGGEETGNSIGNSGEFVGLREYRPGDPLRQIHWKSWAHTGKPMVKELEDTFYPRYGLVLDTFPGSPDEQLFEEMISVAASFIVGLDRNDSLLDLMFIADEAYTVTAGRGLERTGKLLEILAGVKQENSPRFTDLSSTIIQNRKSLTSCILVLNGWDDERADFVKTLIRSGVVCVPLIVGKNEPPVGVIGHWLNFENIAADLLRLPRQLQ